MMLQIELPTSEEEFISMMEIVDSFLREEEIPPHARPIKGLFKIAKSLNLGLRMTYKGSAGDSAVYTGDDLTIRIFSWFEERYGNKLGMPAGPGRVAIMIRGDFWEAQFPGIWGTVKFDIIDRITDLPIGLSAALNSRELRAIADSYIAAYQAMEAICQIRDLPMVTEILGDIDSAVNHLISNPPHYGLSKWASLQTVEKSFKTFLTIKKADVPRHHRLKDISMLAEENGLFAVDKNLISKIQCSAGVRYGDEKISKDEAYEAHRLSVELSGLIAQAVFSMLVHHSRTQKWCSIQHQSFL